MDNKQLEEFFNAIDPNFATHHEWEEEGKRYSSWHFKTEATKEGERSVSINTGDGGAEMMRKAFLERFFKNKFGNSK